MRVFYRLALLIAATIVSGCVSNTLNGLSNLSTNCTVGATSVSCIAPTGTGTGTGTGSTGATTTTTTGGTTTSTTTINTGNTANFTTGDTTLIVEGNTIRSLIGKPAGLSQLNDSPFNHTVAAVAALPALATPALTKARDDALLTANQKISFNTNTANNPNWPVSKALTYSDFGTCLTESAGPGPVGTFNNVNPANPGKCLSGLGGKALGGDYKLYRFYDPATFDEELQVWSWNQSYATQYRDVTASGTDPQHQAWSFGGNYTAAASVPTSGAPVTYTGKWTATAKTTNFAANTTTISVPAFDAAGNPLFDPTSGARLTTSLAQLVAPSNNWRVNGNSSITADFANAKLINSRLTSTNWQGIDTNNAYDNVDPIAAQAASGACVTRTGSCDVTTFAGQQTYQNWINWAQSFMSSDVVLNGTITTNAANATKPNQIIGTAEMDANNGWITNQTNNPMYAGFFGPVSGGKPKEITGTFGLFSTTTSPNAGILGLNNDRRAYIQMSGIFNGQ